MSTLRIARPAIALLTGAAVAAQLLTGIPAEAADTAPVNVTVNTRAGLAAVSDTAVGTNHAIWDTNLGTNETADLLKAAGVKMLRYPGGSYGDIYHWETHTAPGGYVAPNTDFDTFISAAKRTGAQPIIIANYGTGTAQEAADWVKYANITKKYGVKYWEIGNENYGNGHYGADWEADNHADKSPAEYARNLVRYADAMKGVDPTIKIGAVLTTPANWPDGLVGEGDQATWNDTVLSIAASKIDFVILHWYPPYTDANDVLTKTAHIPDMIYLVRRQIAKHAGARAGDIGIAVTEINSGIARNTQPGALFAADAYAGFLEQGVFTVDWWNVHNGIGNVTTIAGQTDYDDFGMLSSGTCSGDVCEPPLNTPFAPYYALSMVSTFARAGDRFVRAATDEPLVAAHAARRPNGDLAVLLINRDPDNERTVEIDYTGFSPAAGAPTVHTYTKGATSISTGNSGTATTQTLPPYSLTTLVVRSATSASGAPSAPGQPTASDVTDKTATISWPAAKPGASPIAKYEIHRQTSTGAEQLGETSGTSFTVHNLVPGTRYTVNVVARDTAGRVSWASAPLTFTTGTPEESSCAVRFRDTNDWGNGFVGTIDITNTGTAALDGWTLHFTWPTTWQSVSSGWSADWVQNGTSVRVTSTPDNRTLAPGASASVGFVGAYSGPNVLPTRFTLNGALCTAQ
ncbi:alpha-L-arabinofuranosidase [Microbispora rosea subsp. aerata]|nr:cellulose binding domain-containing protein [Microbispora rosea]GGO11171.1 alpha-L-arabinofuranosidase [Microbispora rosea subsp. aerata]GIH53567.1 alpha-L-arabinofuranosidase [Microbispora rosea subsp. aerata]GLJ86302.1 alpha-L-arabinofuranosidase [Microbispora rosea subsp. aerata]